MLGWYLVLNLQVYQTVFPLTKVSFSFFFFINATVKKKSQLHLLHLLRFLYVVKLIRSGCGRSKCTLLPYAKDDVVYTGLGWMCVVLSSLFFFVLTGKGRYGIFL